MDVPPHLIDPDQTKIGIASGLGSFAFLMVTRNLGWLFVLTLFGVGQVTAFYFTIPIAMWRGWSPSTYGPLGFTEGAFAMMFWGAVFKLGQNFREDPVGTIGWLWRTWKGGGTAEK